jgi:hypothetical protein
LEGALKAATLHPCGLMPDITLLMVPSFPLVSIPCRTIRSDRVALAYRRSWSPSSPAMNLAVSAFAFSLPWSLFLYYPVSSGSYCFNESLAPDFTRYRFMSASLFQRRRRPIVGDWRAHCTNPRMFL